MAKYPEWLEKIWEEQQSIIATEGKAITPEVRTCGASIPIHFCDTSRCVDTGPREVVV
jgi:hypothetical protein